MMRLIDASQVEERLGFKITKLYADIRKGVMTQPVRLSKKCSRWPEHEVEAVVRARVFGADDEAIRHLVNELHDARRASR